MLSLRKVNKKSSSRRQIDIREVMDDVLVLPNNRYRAILHTSAINFELKSDAERDAIIDTYQSFLNSMAFPLQVLVRTRELDTDKYLSGLTARLPREDEDVYRDQLRSYMEFVSRLVVTNKILTRQFYVTVPFDPVEQTDFTIISEQLASRCDIVAKGLSRIGMQVWRLSSVEILDLFYSFYCPGQSRIQPISDLTLKALSRALL